MGRPFRAAGLGISLTNTLETGALRIRMESTVSKQEVQGMAHQEGRGRLLEGHHAPGAVQAALLPLRHQPNRLAEPHRAVPQPCGAGQAI